MIDPLAATQVLFSAISTVNSICLTCSNAKRCRSFFNCVGTRIELVRDVLLEIREDIETMDPKQANNIIHSVSTLGSDIDAVQKIVGKASNMSRISFIIKSRDLQIQIDRKLSALHIVLMGLQSSQNTAIRRAVSDFHGAWKEREDELRLVAEEEVATRSRISRALLGPETNEAQKSIAKIAGIDIDQIEGELEQARKELDTIRADLGTSSMLLDALARDKARVEAELMDQIIEALKDSHPSLLPPQTASSQTAPSCRQLPDDCLCPITFEIMDDPVIIDAACSHTVSRKAASKWLIAMRKTNCPVCPAKVNSTRLVPNVPLRNVIELIRPHFPPPQPTPTHSKTTPVENATSVSGTGAIIEETDASRDKAKEEVERAEGLNNALAQPIDPPGLDRQCLRFLLLIFLLPFKLAEIVFTRGLQRGVESSRDWIFSLIPSAESHGDDGLLAESQAPETEDAPTPHPAAQMMGGMKLPNSHKRDSRISKKDPVTTQEIEDIINRLRQRSSRLKGSANGSASSKSDKGGLEASMRAAGSKAVASSREGRTKKEKRKKEEKIKHTKDQEETMARVFRSRTEQTAGADTNPSMLSAQGTDSPILSDGAAFDRACKDAREKIIDVQKKIKQCVKENKGKARGSGSRPTPGINTNYFLLGSQVPGNIIRVDGAIHNHKHKGAKEEIIDVCAPAGKLGVVLDKPDDGALVVHTVKDTSPIREKIRVGDMLTAVDNKDVRAMTAIQVSKIVSRKSSNKTRKLTIIRQSTNS